MADIYYDTQTGGKPSPYFIIEVDFTTSRSGVDITLTADITMTFKNSSTGSYVGSGWELWFEMGRWDGSNEASAQFLSSNEVWRSPSSRTRSCSITFESLDNSTHLYCRLVTTNSSFNAGTMPQQELIIECPSYQSPTSPTWTNINPNPCSINAAPLITWGGATVGSLNRLFYDVEVRKTKSSGGWTNWIRIANAQTSTSYQEIVLNKMGIEGSLPYVGVQYQYRIRSSDGSYKTSSWVTILLNVSFGTPTPPTSYKWGATSVKENKSFSLSWSGATGGTGTITQYQLDSRLYSKNNSTWSSWKTSIYLGTATSFSSLLSSLYPDTKNGDQLQIRIRTKNSWNQWSSYLNTSGLPIRANQIWIKVNGSWVEGDFYLKQNGIWEEGMPYIKANGAWKEST